MSFLTIEEIKLWRSSTEKITLEEFAQRLGKSLNEKKETHDLYDTLKDRTSVAEHQEIVIKPSEKLVIIEKPAVKPEPVIEKVETIETVETTPASSLEEEIFKKEPSIREKTIFNYFTQNKGKKISVKELAKLLNLPDSYVYKYIKNLREKLARNILVNAEDGGYILCM